MLLYLNLMAVLIRLGRALQKQGWDNGHESRFIDSLNMQSIWKVLGIKDNV